MVDDEEDGEAVAAAAATIYVTLTKNELPYIEKKKNTQPWDRGFDRNSSIIPGITFF